MWSTPGRDGGSAWETGKALSKGRSSERIRDLGTVCSAPASAPPIPSAEVSYQQR